MRLAGVNGTDLDVERMRLDHRAAGDQPIAFGSEREPGGFAVQTFDLDHRLQRARRQRLAVAIAVQAELRRHAGFIDGDFERERTVAQQAAVVRAALERGGGRVFAFGRCLRRTIATGTEGKGGDDQQRQAGALEVSDLHGNETPAVAVIRSMSVNKVW
jgi:hypothetical protein